LAPKADVGAWLQQQAAIERTTIKMDSDIEVAKALGSGLRQLTTDTSDGLVSSEIPLLP
jgi:hypothetical protein